jgi:hypothetical protein
MSRCQSVYHNPDKKHFIISAPRTASTFCNDVLVHRNGWEDWSDTNKVYDLNRFKELYDQGAKFYVLCKEPTKRLSSGFELAVPILSDLKYDNISSFAGVLTHYISRFGAREIQRYGYMNYCLSDNHLCWGNSMYALFLESVGIETEKLILNTDCYSSVDFYTNSAWGFTTRTLDDYILEHFHDQDTKSRIDYMRHPDKLSDQIEHQKIRDQRLGIYLSIFGGAEAQRHFFNYDHDKFYSVLDWMNDERKAYWGYGRLEGDRDRVRSQEALKILMEILTNMTDKIEMHNVLDDCIHPANTQTSYPVETIVVNVKGFKQAKNLIPDIYQGNTWAAFGEI